MMSHLPVPSGFQVHRGITRSTSPLSPESTPQKPSNLGFSATRAHRLDKTRSEGDGALLGMESIWARQVNDNAIGGISPTTSPNPAYPGSYAFGGPGQAPRSSSSGRRNDPYLNLRELSSASGSFLGSTSSSGTGLRATTNMQVPSRNYLAPPSHGQQQRANITQSYNEHEYLDPRIGPQGTDQKFRSSKSGYGSDDFKVIGQRELLDGSWVCECGLHNPEYFGLCAKCRSSQPSFKLPPQPITPPAMIHPHRSASTGFPTHESYFTNDGMSHHPQPRTFGGVAVSPLAVLSKLANHVEELLNMGKDGIDLKMVLVDGDVNMCLAMGMRGLLGKEAINPWKCVGVEIPDQHIGKYGPKPPLGTIAGDWSCSCGRENWAKRSVCSRCFPGIEPDYKVIVYQYAEPIFRMITEQERHIEIQRGTEWLALEEKKLRRERQQHRVLGGQDVGSSGPTIGRKFIADFKQARSRSPYQDAIPFRSPSYHESLPFSAGIHQQSRGPSMYETSSGPDPAYAASHQSRHKMPHPDTPFSQKSMPSSYRSTSPGDYDQHAGYMRSLNSFYPQVPPHAHMHYDQHFPPIPPGIQGGPTSRLDNAQQIMTDSSPPEARFHLISSPESASSFRFTPFSPDPSASGDNGFMRTHPQPVSPESPTAAIRSRADTRASMMFGAAPPRIVEPASSTTVDGYILTGETDDVHGFINLQRQNIAVPIEQARYRLPPGQDVQDYELLRSKGTVDPIGQGRPASANTIGKGEGVKSANPGVSRLDNSYNVKTSGSQASGPEEHFPKNEKDRQLTKLVETELARAMESTLGSLLNH